MEKHILILAATHDFLWKFERENVKLLQSMGYVVHYAANMKEPSYISYQEQFRQMGVQAHHIEIARSPFLLQENQKALRQLLGLLRKYPIQAIHCHTPVGGLLGRLAGRFFHGRKLVVVYTAHGFHFYKGAPLWNRSTYYWVEKQLARDTDILIVINKEDYESAQRFQLRRGGHLYKIPGVGLDRSRFHPLSEQKRKEYRQGMGIGERDFFLISVGELNENKNHKVILEALAKMKRRGQDLSHIKYAICGDGFFRDRLRRWIMELGLKDTVILYGYRRDVPKIIGCADAMAFPSKREGLGMAGLEALAMGVPVLASDNRGTREYMKPGQNGFVYSHDDVEGFIKGIAAIWSLTPEQKKIMRDRCRDSVRRFDKEHANAVMRAIYADVDRRVSRLSWKIK